MIEKPIKSFFVDSSLAQLRNQLKAHVRKLKGGEKIAKDLPDILQQKLKNPVYQTISTCFVVLT